MAIIGTIRKQSGLAVIIVGVAIAAFVIGDFGKKRAKGTTDIAVVNGEEIPYTDFSTKVEDVLEAQKENRGNEKITDQEAFQIRQGVYDNLIKEVIMGNEYDELGLVVSPEELFDQVQGKQPHRYILQYFKDPKTGVYDPAVVLNYLKQLDQMEPKTRKQWLAFEKAIKDDRQETKFNNLVAKSFYMPKTFLKQDYVSKTRSLKVRFVAPNPYEIADSTVKITDADYLAFYNKNIQFFYQEEPYRDLDFVTFEVLPSPNDRKKTSEDVVALYKDFLATPDPITFMNANSDKKYDTVYMKKGVLAGRLDSLLFDAKVGTLVAPFEQNNTWLMAKLMDVQDRPDTMKGVQCLIAFANSANENIKRTKEQAKARTDSLMLILKKKPEMLATFARNNSDWGTAKDDGGELKDIVDGNLPLSFFYNAGLKMKPKDIQVVETRIGYAIFRLDSKSKPVKKIKAAVVARNIEPSNQTYQDTYTKASSFAGQYRTSDAFDKAASKLGIAKREAPNIRETDNTLMGMSNAREVIRWAFSENTKVGDLSPVFDLQGKYMVAIVKSATPKGNIPLDLVKSKLEASVKGFKKLSLETEKLSKIMQNTKDLYAIATQMKVKVDTTVISFSGINRAAITRDPEVIGTLFTSPLSKLLGPLQGRYGVYAVVIDGINDAPKTDDYTSELQQQKSAFEQRASSAIYPALQKTAKITDSRLRFY
ncbi:MAG: SurA N-terminal domain-containing protein [Bacteroidetes bacterium]|nr:SurA N-terminal domain-containing protein [Bacteroidota bacterium]